MKIKNRTLNNYIFNDEYEKLLLGCVFRNPKRIYDISEKYPHFVEKRNEDLFFFLKERIEQGNLSENDNIFISTREKTAYLIEIMDLTPTDGNFDIVLEKAINEKVLRDYLESAYSGIEDIFRTQNVSQFLELKKQEIESIENCFESEETPEEKAESKIVFPYEIMEGVAGDFALLYSEYLEGAKEFFYIAFMTCLGSFFANSVTLECELHPQPRLYTLLIGQSADARKSTILTKTIEFFKEIIFGYYTTWGIGSAEGLAKIIKEDEPLLMLFDEFKTFISKCKIDNSVLLPMATSLFESNIYEAHTKKSSVALNGAYLSILGASTIATYERMWTPNFLNIGFLNRVFIVPGDCERKFSIPGEIDEKLKQSLKEAVQDITLYVAQKKGDKNKFSIPIDKDAWELYDNWYRQIPRTEHNKRLDTYALRFMILFAINVQKTRVDVDIVEKVIKLMNWQYAIRKAYDPIDAENRMAKMEQSIRRNLLRKNGLKDWELKRATGANRAGLWVYETALKNLRNAGEIKIDKQKRWWTLETN